MSNIDTGSDDSPTEPAALDGIQIRTLHTADEMVQLGEVFQQVWGSLTQLVTIEILMAVAHSGGYVSAAYEDRAGGERMLGASVGILARHHDQPALHSHITGLLPGARHAGLGRAMKQHQREWADDQGIAWIVWTFDPLVQANARFNLSVLGAEVHEYLPSFYGTMTDSINAGDEADRLLVAWDVLGGGSPRGDITPGPGHVLVPTPDDIVALRRTDQNAAGRWRRETRELLQGHLADGAKIVGFTSDGEYVIEPHRSAHD